jgi:coproporphyrinogen III oxidase-like Fe-S oxidoreductase
VTKAKSIGEKKEDKWLTSGTGSSARRKSMRSSTTAKSVETKKRVQIREKLEAKRREIWKSKQVEEYEYTQEELLEECKLTEKANLESLGKIKQNFVVNRSLKRIVCL